MSYIRIRGKVEKVERYEKSTSFWGEFCVMLSLDEVREI